MTKDEALKHLKTTIEAFGPDEGIELDQKAWRKLHNAIKEALAQPEQEQHSVSEEREFWLSVVEGLDNQSTSPTKGMTLGQRISHVGGRENAAGYIEFGSPMAVKALIDHVLRDITPQQPEQNPVVAAWDKGYQQGVQDKRTSEANIGIAGFRAKVQPARQNPYGTTPPPVSGTHKQEPVAYWDDEKTFVLPKQKEWDRRTGGISTFGCDTPLYTTPPQRTWVGLTDDEQQEAYEQWQNDGWGVFYNAIEAKLKEKNT